MTIKEFIKKEKANNNRIGFALENFYDSLKKEKNILDIAETYKYQLLGMVRGIYYVDYISEDEYFELFDDIQHEYLEVVKNILHI